MFSERLEFRPEEDASIFASIPAASAVFLLRSADPAAEPYVSKTSNLRRRLHRLLSTAEARSKRLNLRDRARWIEYTLTGSDFESGFLLYKVLRTFFPKTYSNRLRFRFAPLIKMHLENEFPRASITTRLGPPSNKNIYYGPFFSRVAAEKFLNDVLDFFKMRRCVEDLHPDPAFPGCVYSEMKMCLAPCFKGCTDDAYRAEVIRVEEFLNTRSESLKRELTAARDDASGKLEFENAAAIHARLEKVAPVLQQMPEVVHRIDRLHAVMVQRSAAEGVGREFLPASVALFLVHAGVISGPIVFPISSPEHTKSQSMEARLEEALASCGAGIPARLDPVDEKSGHGSGRPTTIERMEHLAILKRWYYRGTRAGEIFFADAQGVLPMRRIVRGIGRVYKGEAAERELAPAPEVKLENPS